MEEIASIIFLLSLSFLFSGSEVALFSLTPLHKRKLRSEKAGRLILKLISSPYRLLSTILFGNTAVNSYASSLFALLSARLFHSFGLSEHFSYLLDIALFTGILLIVGEITPKLIAIRHSESFSRNASYFLYPLYVILLPVSLPFSLLLDRLLERDRTPKERPILEEINFVLKRAREENQMPPYEYRVIKESLNILTAPVREYMVPRKEIKAIEENTPMDEAFDYFLRTRHSRFPVYRNSLDEIMGILDFPYLFRKVGAVDPEKPVREYMRPAFFVPETMRLIDLIRRLRKTSEKLAIVIDEYGGTSGIITLWDIEREITGELGEEAEIENVLEIKEIGENMYIVSGDMDIEQLGEILGIELGQEGTVAGYIMDISGRVPEEGERIETESVIFEVLQKSGETIESIKVIVR